MKKSSKKFKTGISRRESLKYITLGAIASTYLVGCTTPEEIEEKVHALNRDGHQLSEKDIELLKQKFFTEDERELVRQLANLIIPADDRSGNAEEAGVVEFIEFTMLAKPDNQTKIRGGLKWLNIESIKRFEIDFFKTSTQNQKAILDDIAYPETAPPEFSQGVSFFNTFRDFVASGFWSSKMGVEDLPYQGNVANVWQGPPKNWTDKLGVTDIS